MKFIIKLFPEIMIKSESVRKRFVKILTSNLRNVLTKYDETVTVVRHWDYIEVRSKQEENRPHLIGVAKGVDRKAGLETLIISKQDREINLPPDDLALHLIQHIRDESHHHAISGHRKKRQKAFTQSGLETIEGVGAKRRQALLKYLGGMQGVKNATLDEIASVPGISLTLAEKIFEALKH